MKHLVLKCKIKKGKPLKETLFGFPNNIKYSLISESINQKWFIDKLYFKILNNRYVYLCTIIDSYRNNST